MGELHLTLDGNFSLASLLLLVFSRIGELSSIPGSSVSVSASPLELFKLFENVGLGPLSCPGEFNSRFLRIFVK